MGNQIPFLLICFCQGSWLYWAVYFILLSCFISTCCFQRFGSPSSNENQGKKILRGRGPLAAFVRVAFPAFTWEQPPSKPSMNDHSIFSFHGNLQVSSPGEPKRFYFCSSNPLRYQGRTQPRYQQRLVVGTPEAGDQKPQRARKRIQTRLFVFLQVNFISVSSTILPL